MQTDLVQMPSMSMLMLGLAFTSGQFDRSLYLLNGGLLYREASINPCKSSPSEIVAECLIDICMPLNQFTIQKVYFAV